MKLVCSHVFTSVLVAVLAMFAAGVVHAEEVKLQVGVTGSNSLEGLEDPVSVAQKPEVTELLKAVADKPRDAEFIMQALGDSQVGLDLLLELDLLKPWHGEYAIAFNYVTLEDHDLLVTALAPFADSLAESYRERWPEFEAILSAYDVRSVEREELAYAVIGAMSLDWDGLDVTAEKGLRMTADSLPGGRDFVIWAKEQSSAINAKELYWGSHNTDVDGIRFTTFGDHYSLPRYGLPDLLWSMSSRVANIKSAPRELRVSFYKALAPYYQDDFLRDAGAILRALRRKASTADALSESTSVDAERTAAVLKLLHELQYVERDGDTYALAAPYLSLDDKPMVDAARKLGWQLMDEWLDLNYAAVQAELGQLTASRYDIPYRQLFTQIWHYLFGLANKSLVASGHFADPYSELRVSQGMFPFAFDAELLEHRTELGH